MAGGGGGPAGAASAVGVWVCTAAVVSAACTVAVGAEGCMPWEEECVLAALAELRGLPGRALPVRRSRIRDFHRASRTVHSITASSTTAFVALHSSALASAMATTATMAIAGAAYGRRMDRSGPTSAGA